MGKLLRSCLYICVATTIRSLVHAGAPSANVGGIAGGIVVGILLVIAIIATVILFWKLRYV